MKIRYFYIKGTAHRLIDGSEGEQLTNSEFHDFILNKKENMILIGSNRFAHYQDYSDSEI